jgi:aryl-alcohol dehydrogenase-like predicted oxidoreductase
MTPMSTRRGLLSAMPLALVGSLMATGLLRTSVAHAAGRNGMLKRVIPSSGEAIPAIGMGTSGSFQVPAGGAEYQALREVLKRFFEGGGTVIDTAPTYGNAEEILGPLLAESGLRKRAFIATKLSRVSGREEGLAQFRGTLESLRTDKVELLQVHNLRDWKTQISNVLVRYSYPFLPPTEGL